MAIVKGEGVLLRFYDDVIDDYQPFACSRSITFNMTAETIGKSTIGSGKWKEKEVVSLGWDFSVEGIIYLSESGFADAPEVIDLWVNAVPIQVECIITDEDSNDLQLSGYGLLTGVTLNGNINNISSINITGEGTGELTITP